MLYISRREMVPFAIPPHLPIDRAQALSLGRTHVGPTQADVHEVNAHRSVKLMQHQPWNYWETMSEEGKTDVGPDARTLPSASAKWDNDWNRMTFCVDPWYKMPLKGMTYTYGMLDGLWQGRMMVNNPSSLGPRTDAISDHFFSRFQCNLCFSDSPLPLIFLPASVKVILC
jgi:hypothetical protein